MNIKKLSLALAAVLPLNAIAQETSNVAEVSAAVASESAISSASIADATQTETKETTIVAQSSSAGGISSSAVRGKISSKLQSAGSSLTIEGNRIGALGSVKRFYQSRDYSPVWLTNGKPNNLAKQLDDILNQSINHGLNPFDYGYKNIAHAIRSLKIAFSSTPNQLADFDILLTSAFIQYGHDLTTGKTDPHAQFETWNLNGRSVDTVGTLNQAIANGNLENAVDKLQPPYPEYRGMVRAIAELRKIAAQGGWSRLRNWGQIEPGQTDGRIPTLREILYIMGDTRTPPNGSSVYDDSLVQAVKHFQLRHGLEPDGRIGKATFTQINVPVQSRIHALELNMERWRWLPQSLGSRYIKVNIPDFRVQVKEGNNVVLDSKVVVGRKDRETPIFSDVMEYTVMNPYWHVPKSIMLKDKLKLLKKDSYAMAEAGIKVFRNGKEINPRKVNWSKYSEDNPDNWPFTMRQDPGDKNALGNIKFIFPNRHAIYLHDTPSRHLFGKNVRSYSSGCIRVEKYLDLAEYVLQDWSRDKIIERTSGGKERRVNLPSQIPVHLLYFTSWADEDGNPQFRTDIYKKDEPLANALGV